MNEVLETLRDEVGRIRRELATVTVQLAETVAAETAAEPHSIEHQQLTLKRLRLEARVWELRHLLQAAVYHVKRFDAEAYLTADLRRHPNPTPEQFEQFYRQFDERVKVAQQKAEAAVEKLTRVESARQYLKEVEQRRRQDRDQELGMSM